VTKTPGGSDSALIIRIPKPIISTAQAFNRVNNGLLHIMVGDRAVVLAATLYKNQNGFSGNKSGSGVFVLV